MRWYGAHPVFRAAEPECSIANSQSHSTNGESSGASRPSHASRGIFSIPSTIATSSLGAESFIVNSSHRTKSSRGKKSSREAQIQLSHNNLKFDGDTPLSLLEFAILLMSRGRRFPVCLSCDDPERA